VSLQKPNLHDQKDAFCGGQVPLRRHASVSSEKTVAPLAFCQIRGCAVNLSRQYWTRVCNYQNRVIISQSYHDNNMNAEYRPGKQHGRNNRNRRGRYPRHGESQNYKKKQSFWKSIQSFFSNLFGGKKASAQGGEGSKHRDEPRQDKENRRSENSESTPRRQQPLLEVATPRLYVGNLSYDMSESDLFDLFAQVGPVRNVEIAMDRESNRSKGFGFVEMESLESAKEAQVRFHEHEVMSRRLVVSGAKAQAPRRSAP